MKVHEEKELECPVCDREFARRSYLLLHLERSRCSSAEHVRQLAIDFDGCGTSRYLNFDYSNFCCENCGSEFSHLSSLFQHVEDSADCSFLLDDYASEVYYDSEPELDSLARYIFDHI